MRIVLLYDNFVRDYRGLLLLKALLEKKTHKVWIMAGWYRSTEFAKTINADMIVTGQISEFTTHIYGKFAKENNLRLVINSSESVSPPSDFYAFTVYNTNEINDDIIDLQVVASKDLFDFIQSYNKIKPQNLHKYKFIGFPRFDLSIDKELNQVETEHLKDKYRLAGYKKVYLFISSFLFADAYEGVSQQDMEQWNIEQHKKISDELLVLTTDVLKRFQQEVLADNEVLLIKKHPWDCSGYFEQTFSSANCKIVDNTEYIVPCLNIADFVFHTYSTSALEAWIMDKKTISIQLEKHKERTVLNHMMYEPIAYSYEDLIDFINHYPANNLHQKKLLLAGNKNDGKGTLRLAEEIHKLKPHRRKFKVAYEKRFESALLDTIARPALYIKRKYVDRLKALSIYHLYDKGVWKHDLKGIAKNTKSHDLYTWENERPFVNRMYRHPIRKFAENIK